MVKRNKVKSNKINEELHQSAEMLSTIYDLNPDAISLTRVSDGKIIDCNQEYLNQIGYSREEVIDHTTVELNLLSLEDRRTFLYEIRKKATLTNFEVKLKRKDNVFITVLYSARFVTFNNEQTLLNIGKDITEEKKAENELKESENNFRTFFENIMDAVLLTIPDGTILAANIAAQKMFGYTEQEICKIGRNGLVDVQDPNLSILLKERALKGKAQGELIFIKKDGYKFPGEMSTSIFEDSNGHKRTSMVIRDINERKQAEMITQNLLESEQQLTEELQTSNEELQAVTEKLQATNEELQQLGEGLAHVNQALLESEKRMSISQEISHLGGWELDIDTNSLSWSDEVYRIFGLQPQEFDATYDAFLDCIHPDDRAAVDEAYSNSIREGRDTYEIEHRVVRKSTGEVRIVHEKCEHFKDGYGRIVRSVGMVHDITERKEAEKALVDSEAKYRSLYSSMSEGVALHEIVFNTLQEPVDYIIMDINESYEDITGLKRAEVVGQKASELYGIYKPPYIEIYARVAETGEPTQFETYFEPMDKYFNISVASSGKGKFSTVFEDITERINREKELEINMKKLEYSNKELEQFAYITSHDLREPLRMISSFLQLLERRYKDQLDQDANEFIDYAVNGAKRLDAMTKDLLQYSQITSQQREVTLVNFEHVLEEALINLKVPIEENNAVITHDPLPTIKGDEQLKVQLFQNIIGNAIKYRSQETPKIHISAKKETNQYLFSIKDNGIGMSPEHLERIFTIFQRLHTHEEYEGTGIGLAIVQKIVHQQGGQIWVESELGKGSTFYFTIPNTK